MNAWYVLRSKPGREAQTSQRFVEAGLASWYPKQRVYVKRAGLVVVPLGTYVFVNAPSPMSAEHWHCASREDGFRGWLGGEFPTALCAEEIEIWREMMDGEDDILDHKFTSRMKRGWGEGDLLRVENVQEVGKCLEINEEKLLVKVHFSALLGRGGSLLLPTNLCELYDGSDGSDVNSDFTSPQLDAGTALYRRRGRRSGKNSQLLRNARGVKLH